MVLKLNISNKGKAYKLEVEADVLSGKKIGDIVKGEEISGDLTGYEIEITGGTDFAGFAMKKDVEGIGLKRVLLKEGWGMHKVPKGVKKKSKSTPNGIRLRKTVRGNTVFDKTIQVNLSVAKEGTKKWDDLTKKEESVVVGSENAESPEQKMEEKKEVLKQEEKSIGTSEEKKE